VWRHANWPAVDVSWQLQARTDDKGGEKQEEQETSKTNTAKECKLRQNNPRNTSINFQKIPKEGKTFYKNDLQQLSIIVDT
jgi:hypothetical protein